MLNSAKHWRLEQIHKTKITSGSSVKRQRAAQYVPEKPVRQHPKAAAAGYIPSNADALLNKLELSSQTD
jgi:hypothetical protein